MLASLRPGRAFFLDTEASPPGCPLELFVCLSAPNILGCLPRLQKRVGGRRAGRLQEKPQPPHSGGGEGALRRQTLEGSFYLTGREMIVSI